MIMSTTNSVTIVDNAAENELLMPKGFQALSTLPFEQNPESEISHFIKQALPEGYLDFPINDEFIANLWQS